MAHGYELKHVCTYELTHVCALLSLYLSVCVFGMPSRGLPHHTLLREILSNSIIVISTMMVCHGNCSNSIIVISAMMVCHDDDYLSVYRRVAPAAPVMLCVRRRLKTEKGAKRRNQVCLFFE